MVDKPEGMTSHDVVAVARRALSQSRIGHTGTLDPFATGVLPLACGRATRLVRFMSASDKSYDATVLFGLVTDSYDITGTEVRRTDDRPMPSAVLATLDLLKHEKLQMPPVFSAKKIAGRRAYDLARNNETVALMPVPVHLRHIEVVDLTPDRLKVRLTCTAGYYVRSFAHDLGARLGVGACLEALRRTRSGHFVLAHAAALAAVTAGGGLDAMIPLNRLLPELDGVVVSTAGRERLGHGQTVRPVDVSSAFRGATAPDAGTGPNTEAAAVTEGAPTEWVRVIDEAGALVGVARRGDPDGALRPDIVLT